MVSDCNLPHRVGTDRCVCPGQIKRYLAIFVIALVVLGITIRAFCYEAEEARLLIGSEYFNLLHQAIQEAEHSIWVKMYYIAMEPDDPDNPASIVVNKL
jgi:hypothetical protein